MINNVVLVGRMTRDAELRYTPSNVAVATFSLAVNRNFKGANGERETDFINCVIWRQQAENLANWAKKGALIGITGRIQTRNYENQQGQRVYVTEVVADNSKCWKAVRHVKVTVVVLTTLEDLIIQIHSVEELQLVVHLVDHNLHNLHQTSVVTRVHLVIQIQWIFQMTISHSKNGQNELNI